MRVKAVDRPAVLKRQSAKRPPQSQRNRVPFTEALIESLRAPDPSGRQRIVWDDDIKGFGILLSGVTSTRTWVVQRGGMTRRTIERVDLMGLEEARDIATQWLRQMRNGEDPKQVQRAAQQAERAVRQQAAVEGITLRQAMATHLISAKGGALKASTRGWYEKVVTRHLGDWLDLPLAQLTSAMIIDRHAQIFRSVKAQRGTSAAATANAAMKALGAISKMARRRNPNLRTVDVAEAMYGSWHKVLERQRRIDDADLPGVYRKLVDWPNPLQRDAALLMLFLGLRRTEALALRWSEIDFKRRVIVLPAERVKGNREFTTPLSDHVLDMLKRLEEKGRDESGFVFFGRKAGERIGEPHDLLRALEKLTGHRLGCHDLRRTYSSVANNVAKVPWLDLQRLMSHRVAHVTARYAVPDMESLRTEQEKVTAALLKLSKVEQPKPKIVRRTIRESATA